MIREFIVALLICCAVFAAIYGIAVLEASFEVVGQ